MPAAPPETDAISRLLKACRRPRRPRLTVSILTRDSEPYLAARIAEASQFAEEVMVGVDADSTDRTLEVALEHADVVVRFRHPGQFAAARMLPLEFATGEWILALDDDESMEDSFDAIVPELLSDAGVTHYWFRRKWLVSHDPCEYLFAPPWYPNWALRLFRNDASLVWKPARAHSGIRAQGPGVFEARACILHHEQVQCDDARRERKLALYQRNGSDGAQDRLSYYPGADVTRRACRLREVRPRKPRLAPLRAHPEVRELQPVRCSPWGATFLSVECPREVRADEGFLALLVARNTGRLCWHPATRIDGQLYLSYHLLDAEGRAVVWENQRTVMPCLVQPGEQTELLCSMRATVPPGDYLVEWDFIHQSECWFAECGSQTCRAPLRVR